MQDSSSVNVSQRVVSLSPSTKKQLVEVERLIIHGRYKDVLIVIEEGLKKKDISKKEELSFLIQKGEVEFILGNSQESLQLAELVLKESEGLDDIFLRLDALIVKVVNYFWLGRFKEALEIAEKCLEEIPTAANLPIKKIAKRKAQTLLYKAVIFIQTGNYETGFELAKEIMPIAEESGNKNVISLSLLMVGAVYFMLGELKNSEEYLEKGIEIATELGNKFNIANGYLFLALVYKQRRDYEQALDLHKRAFVLAEEIGSTNIHSSYNNMGTIYRAMFQLDKALECYQESLKHAEMIRHIAYANIGEVYFLKYELEKAQEHYLKSMKIAEEINSLGNLSLTFYSLILISLELNQIPQAQKYLERLEQISKVKGYYYIASKHRFASILVLKASGDISDLVQAAESLKMLLVEEGLPSILRLDVLYTLLEIRIKELQISINENTLAEVKKQTIRLEVEAEEQNRQWLLANIYRLQSQLALIELDAKKAIELLQKAKIIAEETKIKILMKGIKEDQEKIEQQLSMWNDLQKQKAPISETVKLVSLESSLKSIKQETVLEERDEQTGKLIEYRKLFALKI